MSIVTKTGDKGTTGLMFGRRVSKCHPRVEACGTVDELNSAIGMARATAKTKAVRENLFHIQKELVILMGELGVVEADLGRYTQGGYSLVTSKLTAQLDAHVKELEAKNISFKGWATPGENVNSAAFDVARTVCRRAERRVCRLQEIGELHNPEIIIYLNRLADLLWLLARAAEAPAKKARRKK
ncbi:MAG: cob(I)yrinic acid a,c-diamide adenosyltransferase [Verrucomicrobiota bacterium]